MVFKYQGHVKKLHSFVICRDQETLSERQPIDFNRWTVIGFK